MRSHAAVFGEVFDVLDHGGLAAVFQQPAGVALKVARVVIKERLRQVQGLPATGMPQVEALVLAK